MPSLERDHAVPVGLHMPPRDHVETLPGQRQQRRTVLGEQATFLRVLAVMRFRGQLQAPVRQPGVKVLQAPYARPGHEQLAPHHADLGLHRALLMTGIRVAERTIEPVMRLEGLEQVRQARLALPVPLMAHAGGVIEHDPLRHTAQPLEQVAQRQARALSVLARHQLHQTDVRIREIKHEMMHPLHHAAQQHVDLAEIGLRLAWMPYQIHERLITLRRELTPEPRHRPRHRGQGDLRAMLVPQPAPRSWSRYAAACASSRDPPRATARSRADTVDHRRARLSHRRHADRSSFARYLRTVGSLTCVFRAIDATDSPFRRKRRIDCTWGMLIIILSGPFWRRYKHHPVKTIPWSACSA